MNINKQTPIGDEWILATVAAMIRYDDGTEADGGVRYEKVADCLGRSREGKTADKMRALWKQGELYRQPLPTPRKPGTPYSYHLEEPQTLAEQAFGENS